GTRRPIAGVSVRALNNSLYAAMTDERGAYTIKVPVFVTSLYVSSPDYNATQIALKGETDQDARLYSGIVRPLYTDGTQLFDIHSMSVDNTSALTVENDIENVLNSSVRTINRGGLPAQGAVMFINGLNSLNANSQPLIVIDGVIQDMQYDRSSIHEGFINNVFNIVDPEDIENVEVLKTGTALYGARGANGVIRITTRRGKSMVTRIKIRAFGGFETIPERTRVLNASQYRNYVTEFLGTTRNAEFLSSTASAPFMSENKDGYLFYDLYHNETDWQKDLYRTAFTQNYRVGVEGGDDVAMYNLSLGYSQGNATARKNDFNRLNIRFNTDIMMFRNFTSELDIAYARSAYNILDNGWAPDYSRQNVSSPNVLGLIQAPFIDPYSYFVSYRDQQLYLGHTDNVYAGKNYSDANNPFAFATAFGFEGLPNPYWILLNGNGSNKNYQEQTQFNLNIAPKYQINRYLTVQDRFSYILNRSNEKYYLPHDGTPTKEVEGLGGVQSVNRSQFGKETTLFNDLMVNWKRNFAAHHINLLAGFRFASYSYTDSRLVGYNNTNDKMPNISYNLQYRGYGGTHDSWTNLAYYLDAAYNYQNKYFLNVATTMEASSRFGKEAKEGIKLAGVKWGIFPSVQAGWLISSEKWFNVPSINYLKLTAGYEEAGNDNVDYYATRTYFENLMFLEKATSLVLANIENPKIQWETTRKFNVGLNLNMLHNRLALGINYFQSKTSNLLTRKSVSDIAGVGFMWGNDGALKNRGVEFNTNAVLIASKDWKWQAGFSIGHYQNKITALPSSDLNKVVTYGLNPDGTRDEASRKEIHGYLNSIYGVDNVLTAVGRPVGVFYGYKTAGVFSTDAEARMAGNGAVTGHDYLLYPTGLSAQPYRHFQAGDVHFVDQNGDGWINEADMVEIGNPNPDIYGNIYTNLSWKNLTLDVIFKYSLGNDVYNYQRAQLESANNIWNQTSAVANRWRFEGQQTDVPRTMSSDNDQWVNNERFSDRWIEDGSYLKLKKVRLSYKLPLNLSWLQGVAVWGEANNVFTLTKYLGADPEFSCGSNVLYQGIDAGWLPTSRSFNFGLTINL
ncbi:MAG: SusC/RagA family TonB-linked outer membrane protein, partial [Alloprevotella sp.]|nr:SusC/RagA family TonB-linked outer membrane protein [Alloprevotella sp.]